MSSQTFFFWREAWTTRARAVSISRAVTSRSARRSEESISKTRARALSGTLADVDAEKAAGDFRRDDRGLDGLDGAHGVGRDEVLDDAAGGLHDANVDGAAAAEGDGQGDADGEEGEKGGEPGDSSFHGRGHSIH
jgi:hypothetical protein